MSYYSAVGGSAGFSGFGYIGLSGTFPIREPDASMRDLQRELQRLGYLQPGSGVYGADGEFGPRTATALRGAARYVGWTDAPYSPSDAGEKRRGEVTVPEDLIDRIKAASPNPDAPFADGGSVEPEGPVEPEPSLVIGPHLDPESTPREEGSNWVPAALLGGGVLLVGGVIAYSMYKKKPKKPKPNRRRRRRRRTSRR